MSHDTSCGEGQRSVPETVRRFGFRGFDINVSGELEDRDKLRNVSINNFNLGVDDEISGYTVRAGVGLGFGDVTRTSFVCRPDNEWVFFTAANAACLASQAANAICGSPNSGSCSVGGNN